MNKKAKKHAVRVVPATTKDKLSGPRKQFNTLIKRLESERQRLATWHEEMPRLMARAGKELFPLEESYDAHARELIRLLDTAYDRKGLTKKEREKISIVICDFAQGLLVLGPDEEIEAIYKAHSDDLIDEDDDEDKAELCAMAESMFGVRLSEAEMEGKSLAEIAACVEAKLEELSQQQENKRPGKPKSAAALAREERHQAEEAKLQQSVRDIFRKLTSSLHPDREQDPAERDRKTALMQRVNVAYAANDLLGLLELQLEVQQIDQGALDRLDEAKIKQYNILLQKQIDEVNMQTLDFELSLLRELDFPIDVRPTPPLMWHYMEEAIGDLEEDISDLERDLNDFKDLKKLKAYLRTVDLEDYDDDDLFF